MLHRTALCVGINEYLHFPSATLNGCVNDAHDMASLLKDLLGFEDSHITQLTDQAATKANIMRELNRMVEGALAGRYDHLVFSLSGHGTQVPDLNLDEFDRADEAYCPHDLTQNGPQWDRDHLIVDKVLAKVRSDLSAAHFTQTPQLDCEAITRHAVLKAIEVPPNVMPLPTEMPS